MVAIIKQMSYRYSYLQRNLKRIYRKFNPVPGSSYTKGDVEDICAVDLIPPEKLKKFFKRCIRILQSHRKDDIGDYLEFGVFNGSSIGSMYFAKNEVRLESMNLYGFDAFEGLPEEAEHEDGGVWEEGFYACSYEQMRRCLQRRGINSDEMNFIKGWYKETLNKETASQYDLEAPGVIFIDCDTYSSSKQVLDFISPLLTRAAIICLDDWKLNDLDIKGMGEYKSFNEFLDNNGHLDVQEIDSYNRKSKSFLVKP
jgi:hypothetical protein